jgi:hypothetical protein
MRRSQRFVSLALLTAGPSGLLAVLAPIQANDSPWDSPGRNCSTCVVVSLPDPMRVRIQPDSPWD